VCLRVIHGIELTISTNTFGNGLNRFLGGQHPHQPRQASRERRIEMATTYYSKVVLGDEGNYFRKVKFDKTGQYVGITQLGSTNQISIDRVLLTTTQINKMIEFIRPKR